MADNQKLRNKPPDCLQRYGYTKVAGGQKKAGSGQRIAPARARIKKLAICPPDGAAANRQLPFKISNSYFTRSRFMLIVML
jgi:hypothetical protein